MTPPTKAFSSLSFFVLVLLKSDLQTKVNVVNLGSDPKEQVWGVVWVKQRKKRNQYNVTLSRGPLIPLWLPQELLRSLLKWGLTGETFIIYFCHPLIKSGPIDINFPSGTCVKAQEIPKGTLPCGVWTDSDRKWEVEHKCPRWRVTSMRLVKTCTKVLTSVVGRSRVRAKRTEGVLRRHHLQTRTIGPQALV